MATIKGHGWFDFVNAIGLRESSNNYKEKNPLGYLGRFQFGLARLCDFGLTERTIGTKGFANNSFRWRDGWSEDLFLSSPMLQDKVFEIHVADYRALAFRRHLRWLGRTLNGVEITLSGIIACFHLLGPAGFHGFVRGKDPEDGYGTKASDYIRLFSDYEIPTGLDTKETVNLRNYVGEDNRNDPRFS